MNTRITKLTLQGFKSFRKRVSVPFFPGFVIFTGPNGAGKSNLLDAICFVLGRTSTKSLRAGRLHELIYHGHGDVPPSEYASVSLWLDNSNGTFPLEEKEISVKRKINRKGVSVYKLNGRTTTRERILEVLSSAMLNPDGHNIIMQGDVAQIIEMTPQERREVIDEISGISRYDEKKEKAEKNLGRVEGKLKEVEIILTERLDRLQDLEKDRNTALKYKESVEKLELLKASLAHVRFKLKEREYESMEEEIKSLNEGILRLEEEIRALDREIESKEKLREEITERVFLMSKEAGIREEIEDVKTKILRNKTSIESNQREIDRIDKMIGRLKSLGRGRSISFTKGVKEILNLRRKGIHGTISSLIKVPKEYEVAVEVAGGSRLGNLIVEDVRTAVSCIDHLKRKKIGRATFLPLNKITPRKLRSKHKAILKKPGVIGLASDLLRYDSKYSPAIAHVFGNTIIVENLGVARKLGIGKLRMVTLEGDLTERSGAMIGGHYVKRELIGTDVEIEEYEGTKRELEEEINFLRIEIGQLNKKMDELRKGQEQEAKEVLDLEDQRTGIDEELERLKIERNEKFEERIKSQNKINRLKIKNARNEAELNNLRLEVERYPKVEYLDEEPSSIEKKIQRTTALLNSLGLVNMKAIEEYDSFKGEFDELKSKYDEIREEKGAILDMMERIEEKRKETFYDCLRNVDKNFKEMFKEMANGKASVELENPLDIGSGLMIKANPSGKRMLNIDSISGGEKALTALAFLFAIQKFKPAPFYVLDEIDATLDKVNTKKVIDVIKRLSKEEQFMVITHNDYTIKQGDKVYGMTMEGGESKILGLELPA